MRLKNQYNKGFTLIELMITVAIVGILAAIALPAYQDYTIRSQIAEGLSLVNGPKIFVVDYYTNKGVLPVTNADVGLPNTKGKYTSSINLVGGNLIITYSSSTPQSANSQINGDTITFTPSESANSNLMWGCSSTMPAKFLPKSCN